jgi:hypothetical protein
VSLVGNALALAHDTWVQVNSPRQEVGQLAFIELCLGNHANDHRDYRLASRLSSLDNCRVTVHHADGPIHSLNAEMNGFGTAANEGPWIGSWAPPQAGRYFVESRLDLVKGTARARQLSRAFFVAGESQNDPYSPPSTDFPIDLVPITDPLQATAGQELVFRVIFAGQPQANAKVSFLPLGVTLNAEFDERYERVSDEAGLVRFTPPAANRYLIVTKRMDQVTPVEGIERLAYTASCTIVVHAAVAGTQD